ncbi:MAG TPA: hypothetical protein VHE61_15725 [Opitutaceae bacterium]|nr:hypothetical protein [Opitutaceae bacterium]
MAQANHRRTSAGTPGAEPYASASERTTQAGVGAHAFGFEGIALGVGFGARGEVLADAFSVEPSIDAKNDFS